MRRIALTLALCASGCTPQGGVPQESPAAAASRAEQVARALASPTTEPDAIRFLEQATFGPRLAPGVSPRPIDSVGYVMNAGISQAITLQLRATPSRFDGTTDTLELGPQFFTNALQGPDQLRQRVAFALSQILVVSQNGIGNNPNTPESEPKVALATYLNLLSDHAFGNFRELLEAITRNPAMGNYLDMVNNHAVDPTGAPLKPNENYAREMLQLFTLGLNRLNDDGTLYLNPQGQSERAYTEEQVQAFSRALSGWTYANAVGCTKKPGRINPPNYSEPMIGCDLSHDSSPQQLFSPKVTTAGLGAEGHLKEALDNVFEQATLPPFISKQLIQHLVTSNPSPEYVGRVVAVFKNNGQGVRGDLGAVVRAILEDPEARGIASSSPPLSRQGRLRPPVLFITSLVRWLNGTLDTSGGKNPAGLLNGYSRSLGQDVPRPPSVFSYYPPNAPAPDVSGMLGPEFAILDTATATARANFAHDLFLTDTLSSAGVVLDPSAVPATPSGVVGWLGRYWLHGDMSSRLQTSVTQSISQSGVGSTRTQGLAFYLTSLSPEFQIQR